MKIDRPEANTELHGNFEPLRIGFVLAVLVLGLIAGLHF